MKIYHNPRCRKSRETLKLLEENGAGDIEVIRYLDTPPSGEELKQLIRLLDIEPEDLVRKNESVYKEQYKGKELSGEEWIDAMTQHPKLIQRPIVVKGDKAIIGRPPENVKELL